MAEPTPGAGEFWERFYRDGERAWSGRVSPRLAETAAALTPGRALDLGCGEGADAVWLAEHGWRVSAVDVSATALARARAAAEQHGVAAHIDFSCADLPAGFPDGRYDLVSAQFLHSPARLDRDEVLRRAAAAVAPGGLLLIVGHAAPPPWAPPQAHRQPFPDVAATLGALGADEQHWDRVRAEEADRAATGPDGQAVTLTDIVIALWRRG